MQVLHNVGGDTFIHPGETHYWWYTIDQAANTTPGFNGDAGICYAMPQMVYIPFPDDWNNGKLWVTQQGLESSNNPVSVKGNPGITYHVTITADPGNEHWLEYQLQIALFEQ